MVVIASWYPGWSGIVVGGFAATFDAGDFVDEIRWQVYGQLTADDLGL